MILQNMLPGVPEFGVKRSAQRVLDAAGGRGGRAAVGRGRSWCVDDGGYQSLPEATRPARDSQLFHARFI